MKLPNGYGSIFKNGNNRRKPYRIMVTTGWNDDGTPIRVTLGYSKTKNEGLQMLAQYHGEPFDLDYKDITFNYIWENSVIPNLEKLVENNKMSESNLKVLKSTYKNHCNDFKDQKILNIKYKKLQELINKSELKITGKKAIRTVCVKTFNCAIDEYELPIKNNPAIRLTVGTEEVSKKHICLSEHQLNVLWDGLEIYNDSIDNDIIKMMLIFCYSGMRPNELFKLKRNDVHLEDNYMIGGSKTKAGKDRIIPIHKKVKSFIEYFLDKNDYETPFILDVTKFNYGKFSREFKKTMSKIGLNCTAYDGRHTFSTKMKSAKADENILKIILGHAINDVTERYYTHRDIMEIVKEVDLIN